MICLCEYLTRAGRGRRTGGDPAGDMPAEKTQMAERTPSAANAHGSCGPENAYGVRILECRSLDSLAALPDRINGFPVVELAPYLFSAYGNREDDVTAEAFWWSETAEPPAERTENAAADPAGPGLRQELPALCGGRLEELRLPAHLEKVGAYAFYNCEKLKRLELYSTTIDWGAGVFTGCFGVEQVTIHVEEDRKSCMREVLAELRQTLEVFYLPEKAAEGTDPRQRRGMQGPVAESCASEDAAPSARIIFPEFFEEAVENTPARILVTETHGCGQKYRNAFVSTQFQFKEYDSLFPHVQVQEPETLVARLALGRLMYPYRLEERYADRYLEYLGEHASAAAGWAVENGDMQALEWIFTHISCNGEMIAELLEVAGTSGNSAAVSFLMDRRRAAGAVRRKFFSL